MRAIGLVEATTRTVTPACTVPFEYEMVIGTLTVVPGVAVLSALTVSLPSALTFVVTWSEETPPAYVYSFSSSYNPDGECVKAVRSMVVEPSPATTSTVEDEKVGAGTSRPITVIGRVNTAELTIFTLPFPACLPSTAVNVIEAGPA